MAKPVDAVTICEVGLRDGLQNEKTQLSVEQKVKILDRLAEAGFTRFDSAFAGVGGCPFVPGAAGNVVTEDLLHLCDMMGGDRRRFGRGDGCQPGYCHLHRTRHR